MGLQESLLHEQKDFKTQTRRHILNESIWTVRRTQRHTDSRT